MLGLKASNEGVVWHGLVENEESCGCVVNVRKESVSEMFRSFRFGEIMPAKEEHCPYTCE
jgi:hypothetical protein